MIQKRRSQVAVLTAFAALVAAPRNAVAQNGSIPTVPGLAASGVPPATSYTANPTHAGVNVSVYSGPTAQQLEHERTKAFRRMQSDAKSIQEMAQELARQVDAAGQEKSEKGAHTSQKTAHNIQKTAEELNHLMRQN